MLEEVHDRDNTIKELLSQKKRKQKASSSQKSISNHTDVMIQEYQTSQLERQIPERTVEPELSTEVVLEAVHETEKPKKPVPYVRVYDYEELRREAGLW